jgi:serine protease Do
MHMTLDLSDVAGTLSDGTVEVISARGDGMGAGIVWGDGLIVTNAHVARGKRMDVAFHNGDRAVAQVAAWDGRRDLALLVVDSREWRGAGAHPLRIREAPLRVGELVIAVGHPLGVTRAVTAGIVHAVGVSGPRRRPWILADVRLAPGISGGPLADAEGRVVGVNAMIINGLAFAVPVATVERFIAGAGLAMAGAA